MTKRGPLVVTLAMALLAGGGCGDDSTAPQPPGPTGLAPTAVAAPAGTPGATAPPAAPVGPAAPAPQAILCPGGASVDPPEVSFEEIDTLRSGGQREVAFQVARSLALQYPQSAKARVVAATLVRGRVEQGGTPAEAQALYQQALQLHQGGCRLSEGDEWSAIEGLALAMMHQSNFAGAIPWLQHSNSRWPSIPGTTYNLACAYCLIGNLEQCHSTFVRALQVAAAARPPTFIINPRSAAGYVTLSQTDPDLSLLRGDPRYQAAIAPYLGQP